MKIKAAFAYLDAVFAEQFTIPGLFRFRRSDPQFTVILEELRANIDALITDIPGMPFEKSCDLAFTETAE
jgi:hypothetical protein